MFKFLRQKKQEKELVEQIDGRYPIRLDLPLRVVYVRKLTVADFISDGLMLNFFVEKTGNAGRFAKLQKLAEQQEEKETELNDNQNDFINVVLKLGLKDYSSFYLELLEVEKIIIFNYIIISSCEKFSDITNPDKNIALNCHYLAKNYGGDPWKYLTQSPDQFLFNLYCLNVGLKDEQIAMKKAMKKQSIK